MDWAASQLGDQKDHPYQGWQQRQVEIDQGQNDLNTAAIAHRQHQIISQFQSPDNKLEHQPWNPQAEEIAQRQKTSQPQLGMISNLAPPDYGLYLNANFPNR